MSKNLSKQEAGRITRYGAGLVRLGLLTSDDFLILHTMLWVLRKPGEAEMDPSYADIQRLTRKCRNTIAQALERFEGVGLMCRKARWLMIEWGRRKPDGRGRENLRARRTTNLYRFMAHACHSCSYASVRSTASSEMSKLVDSVEQMVTSSPLEEALTRVAETAGFRIPVSQSSLHSPHSS